MRTINKYKDIILDWFYLDKDDITVRRAKNGYRGRYAKHDAVIPYRLCAHGYGGIHIPTTRTTVPYHHLLTVLRGIEIPDTAVIDHQDGDTSNNHRDNIRIVTQSTNCRNASKKCNNTSGVTGINWNTSSASYVVRKQLYGKRKYLGQRQTLAEAIELLNSYEHIIKAEGYTERHGQGKFNDYPAREYTQVSGSA